MTIRIKCTDEDCGWVHEAEPSDIDPWCKQCGAPIERFFGPKHPSVQEAIDAIQNGEDEIKEVKSNSDSNSLGYDGT